MLRCALFAIAVCAIVPGTRAADPDLSGNWLLSYSSAPGLYQNFCILKVESKDGKATASVVYPTGMKVTSFKVSGNEITAALSAGPSFIGTVSKGDAKDIVGSFGDDRLMFRSKLTRTDKDTIAKGETIDRTPGPDEFTKAQSLIARPNTLRAQASREKNAEAKKDLLAKVDEAQKEANEKAPALLRTVADKHTDEFGSAAAMSLLTSASKFQVTADEAKKLVAMIEKQSATYGPRYVATTRTQIADALSTQKELGEVAVAVIEPMVKAITDKTKAADEQKILTAYKSALTNAGKTTEAKTVETRLVKLETKLDEEYMAKVPPFKPAAYAGRKDKDANQVAVMELFTGAQCPPCVAADVAFDALAKSYKPKDVILIQYHLHIPGPDPMTNADSEKRFAYYREQYQREMGGTPSTVFNGKPAAGGGGGMANAENKFKQYSKLIDETLEKKTDVKVSGKASRTGDKIDIAVDVAGGEGDDMKLRLLVVEETVKYVGGNQLRFHHYVVRSMPGGADGVAIKDKSFKHTAATDVGGIRETLTKYLDDYAANTRPFPSAARPLDMKHLKVIALVQNDKTKEIVSATQFDLGDKATSTSGQ